MSESGLVRPGPVTSAAANLLAPPAAGTGQELLVAPAPTDGYPPRRAGFKEPPRTTSRILRRRLLASDMLALLVAGVLGLVWAGARLTAHLLAAEAVALAATLVAMRIAGLYRARRCALRSSETGRVLVSVAAGTAALAAFEPGGSISRLLPPEALLAACFVLVLRWRFGRWLRAQRAEGRFLRTVVLVGTNDDAAAIWTMLDNEPELGYRIGAVHGSPRVGAPWRAEDWSDDGQDLPALAERVEANGVIVVAGALEAVGMRAVVDQAQAAGLHVQVWPSPIGLTSWRVRMAPVSAVPVLYLEPQRVTPWQRGAKRLVDVVLACSLLLLASPLMLLAAVLVKVGDRGPVLFRSGRVGRGGQLFTVLKFRTMVPDAERMVGTLSTLNERTDGPLFKASRDPRVTAVGRILRASSIDELPQLWNVLNGTMSLVGPRPALPSEADHFDEDLVRRHTMRPGITGLWQIEARDNPSFSVYRRLDLAYVDNWHLALDFSILATTAREVTTRAVSSILRPGKGARLD